MRQIFSIACAESRVNTVVAVIAKFVFADCLNIRIAASFFADRADFCIVACFSTDRNNI